LLEGFACCQLARIKNKYKKILTSKNPSQQALARKTNKQTTTGNQEYSQGFWL